MLHWKKLGRLFDPGEHPERPGWMKEFAQAPASLIFDDYVRVYFSCRPARDQQGQYVSYTGYVDLDRNNLFTIKGISKEPILSLGALGTFDEFGTYPVSVIRRDTEVWAYYAGWTRCTSVPFNVSIGAAVSQDHGVSFTKIGRGGPILTHSLHEPFILSGPKIRKFNDTYYLFYIAGRRWVHSQHGPEPVYKIRMAQSPDGLRWTKLDKDLIESRIEADEAQASPDVIYCNNTYHMFFCYRHSLDYRTGEKGYRIGYASSPDLIHWTRADEKAGLPPSSSGWDAEMVSYPHVFELDGHTYMMYLGNQVGRWGFGIAELESPLE